MEQDYYESDEEEKDKKDSLDTDGTIEGKLSELKMVRSRMNLENGYGGLVINSLDGKYVYRVGVIDFITRHDFSKTVEQKAKSILYGVDTKTISAQKPDFYQKRYVNYFSEKLRNKTVYDI
jgi:hypothetical protein